MKMQTRQNPISSSPLDHHRTRKVAPNQNQQGVQYIGKQQNYEAMPQSQAGVGEKFGAQKKQQFQFTKRMKNMLPGQDLNVLKKQQSHSSRQYQNQLPHANQVTSNKSSPSYRLNRLGKLMKQKYVSQEDVARKSQAAQNREKASSKQQLGSQFADDKSISSATTANTMLTCSQNKGLLLCQQQSQSSQKTLGSFTQGASRQQNGMRIGRKRQHQTSTQLLESETRAGNIHTPGSIMDMSFGEDERHEENQYNCASNFDSQDVNNAQYEDLLVDKRPKRAQVDYPPTQEFSSNTMLCDQKTSSYQVLAQTAEKVDYLKNKIQRTTIHGSGEQVFERFLRLTNKETGKSKKFKRYPEEELQFLQSEFPQKCVDKERNEKTVSDFDMTTLELEYDYETDEDQILKAKQMLATENFQAVEYFVHDDPLYLIGNLQ